MMPPTLTKQKESLNIPNDPKKLKIYLADDDLLPLLYVLIGVPTDLNRR